MAKVKARFGREDWLELGLSLLAREGPPAMTLDRLTQAAERTRGSFYHHFWDHQDFLAALGALWLEQQTDAIIAQTEAAEGQQRELLARKTAMIDHALEREMRQLAARERVIAEILAQADEKRIAYLARLFRSELGLDAADALARARIQHSFFVGAEMVFPDADARFRLNLQKTLGATLWRR